MPITWISVRGQGYFLNGKLIGRGFYINENDYIMEKNIFNNGLLNDSNGTIIDYSDSANVVIRVGPCVNGLEHGNIIEYIFPKSLWETFLNNNAVLSTKYEHIYTHGSWQSTASTTSGVSITGQFIKTNNIWRGFGFIEN